MYKENDKVMLLETGEVLTVLMDLTDRIEAGLVVQENIGRNLKASEVRPAGHTRERVDASLGVVESEPFPPPPIDNMS